jgi:hypothetical protein
MSKVPPLLESPKRRLRSAKDKIRRLEKRIDKFFKNKPARHVVEPDTNGFSLHVLQFHRKIPDSCADVAVEAIEALRSALDQCGYAIAVRAGIAEPKYAYFPFGDSVADLDANTKGRCKDLPPEISAIFRSFDSHKGGNYTLWALNKLCNANKHRLLIPVSVASGGMRIKRGVISGDAAILNPIFDRMKNQIVLARVGPNSHFEYEGDISFFIAFDEFNGVESSPAIGTLDAAASEVDRVLRAAEAECNRIGLI